MTVLRIWLIGTCIVLVGMMVWAFVPVLVFVLLLTAGLGIVCAAMIGIARALRAWLGQR